MFGTLFRNRVFVDDQVKMSSVGWALIPHDLCPYKKVGDVDTEMDIYIDRMPCEDWSSVPQAQESPKAKRGAWNRPFPCTFRDGTAGAWI